jgi:two-component system sensor histidine kinase DesK
MAMLYSSRLVRLGRVFCVATLAFYLLPVSVILTGRFRAQDKLVALAVLLASAAIWTWFWTRILSGPDARYKTLAVTLAAVLFVVFDLMTPPQYGSMFVYLVVMLGAAYAWRTAIPLVILAALGAGALDFVRTTSGIQAFGDVINEAIVGLAAVAGRLLIDANRQLSVAREQIARLAVDEERLRFARDLHDLLGHSLSVIAMKSELAGRLITRSPGLAEHEVHDVERVAREALQEVREAVAGYREPTIATELAGARAALSAANVTLMTEPPRNPLPSALEAVLAWTIREGVTNVIRHSQATRCAIRFFEEGDCTGIEIVDNGRPATTATLGSGLRGLEERVGQRGGTLEAGALPHEGYRLRVRLPLRQPVDEPAETASQSA